MIKKQLKVFMMLFSFMFFIIGNLYAQDKPTLAIADFEGKDKELSKGITEIFATDLSKSKLLSIVERAQIEKAAKEAGKKRKGVRSRLAHFK